MAENNKFMEEKAKAAEKAAAVKEDPRKTKFSIELGLLYIEHDTQIGPRQALNLDNVKAIMPGTSPGREQTTRLLWAGGGETQLAGIPFDEFIKAFKKDRKDNFRISGKST